MNHIRVSGMILALLIRATIRVTVEKDSLAHPIKAAVSLISASVYFSGNLKPSILVMIKYSYERLFRNETEKQLSASLGRVWRTLTNGEPPTDFFGEPLKISNQVLEKFPIL